MSNAKVNMNVDNLDDFSGITVVAQQSGGKVHKVTLELIGKGRELADKLGCKLSVFLMGHNVGEVAQKLSFYGADSVVVCDDEKLKDFTTEAYTSAVSQYVEQYKPESMFFGATTLGRDFAPRVAARVGTGLTADCTSLDVDDQTRNMLQTRPAFGGNLMATIICPRNRPQMSTVRPGVMEKAQKTTSACEIINFNCKFDDKCDLVNVVDTIIDLKKKVNLADAEIIVCGGRGVGSAEGFELLKSLADKLGGVVGSSRAAVDSGFMPHEYQIGQTGAVVKPKVYIACGISGAIQHLIGMQDSEYIVAINTNADAPIMSVAHLALVGDLFQVIPEIMNLLDEAEAS